MRTYREHKVCRTRNTLSQQHTVNLIALFEVNCHGENGVIRHAVTSHWQCCCHRQTQR